MAVESLQSANAAAPARGASTAAPAAAPTPTADAAMSFEDMVAAELGPEPAVTVNPETSKRSKSKPAPAAIAAAADADENDEDEDDDDAAGTDGSGEDDADADADGDDAGEPGDADASDEADQAEADGEPEPDENADHDDLPAAHFKKLPAWAQKRLGKQSAALKAAREELAGRAFAIAPTPENPLAHVETVEDLHGQVDLAKQIRTWCKANPDGGVIGKLELTPEDVEARLAHAESVIEAAPDWQSRLTARATAKPWEAAKRVCPEMFQGGTEEQQFAAQALKLCPELKTKLPNWEMFLAAAVRSIKQVKEEAEGKAKYVRMGMDKDGKVIPPTKPAGSQKPGTKPAPQAGHGTGTSARPPVTPGGTPPPLRSTRGGKPDTTAIEARFQKSRDPDDFAALVAAELG